MVSRQLLPEGNCIPIRVGVWVKVRDTMRVGGKKAIAPEENCPSVRVRVSARVSFGVRGQFCIREIVLEPS